MSKVNVVAVIHRSKNLGHRVVCTFDNYKDAGDWIEKQYQYPAGHSSYYATDCQMEIVSEAPHKGARMMTVMYDDHFGEGTLAMRCTIEEMAPTSLLWMRWCKKATNVPVVYTFEEKNL